jgi:hypothetical protein
MGDLPFPNRKKLKQRTCYICGRPATTTDHIPPRGFFPRLPHNIILLPSCRDCNHGASRDEEYVRTSLAAFGYWTSQAARQVWHGAVVRSFRRGRGVRNRLAANLIRVVVRDPSGRQIGVLPGLSVDGARAARVFRKIVRGIHYFERAQRLPDDELLLFRGAEIPDGTIDTRRWKELDMGEAFRYRFAHDEGGSMVWFEFYRNEWWLALTGCHARNYPRR